MADKTPKTPKHRIISYKMIRDFLETVRSDESAAGAFDKWYEAAEHAHWHNFADLRETFGKADQARGTDLVVFNIGGNKYRLIARVNYARKTIFIRAVLTHEEYDKNGWLDL